MEELIKNVEIIKRDHYTDYIKFHIKLQNGKIIVLDRCRATNDFKLIPMPIEILAGEFEVEDTDKTIKTKAGILHIYSNKNDLLLL